MVSEQSQIESKGCLEEVRWLLVVIGCQRGVKWCQKGTREVSDGEIKV